MANKFEKELFDIASAYMQTKNPELMKYNIGFQIIKYDEKLAKGQGFFVLNLNGKYFYIPVVYNNGELKDIILMYDKSNDKMYPATEEWLQFHLSKNPITIAKGINKKPDISRNPFDFRNINISSFFGKTASNKDSIIDFVKQAGNKFKANFIKAIKIPEIGNYFINKYGYDNVLNSCKPHIKRKLVKKANKLKLLTRIEEMENYDPFQKLEFIKNGFYIDDRDFEVKTKPVEIDLKFQTPFLDGIYKISTSNGIKDTLVSLNPFTFDDGKKYSNDLVIDLDNGSFCFVDKHSDILTTMKFSSTKEIAEKIKTKSLDTMEIGKKYCMFNHTKGDDKSLFSIPFIVKQKATLDNGHTFYNILDDAGNSCKLITRDRDKFFKSGNEYYIPKNTMVIEVKENDLHLVNENLLNNKIFDDYNQIKVSSDYSSINYFVKENSKRIDLGPKPKAYIKLAELYEIPLEAAKDYIDNKSTFFIKKSARGPFVSSNADYKIEDTPDIDSDEFYSEITDAEDVENTGRFGNTTNEDIKNLLSISQAFDLKIFDDAMLGILSSIQDVGIVFSKDIPKLTDTLDALGKQIYMLWIHGYKISDNFGLNEMAQFESKLKDTFINLGDIILTLYNKQLVRI